MPLIIIPLTPEQRKNYLEGIVGQTTCPICHQTDIKVHNDNGPKGNPRFSYMENHNPIDDTSVLCLGSEKFLSDFP